MIQSTELEIDYSKLVGYSGKTMLVLTIVNIDGEAFLRIESEPHYWLNNRYFRTDQDIPKTSTEGILNNFSFCCNQGFTAFGLLLIPIHQPQAVLLSIHDYKGFPVLRFDGEKYTYKDHREFIDQIPLPPWKDEDDILFNDRLKQVVGKRVLEILLSYEDEWPPKG